MMDGCFHSDLFLSSWRSIKNNPCHPFSTMRVPWGADGLEREIDSIENVEEAQAAYWGRSSEVNTPIPRWP